MIATPQPRTAESAARHRAAPAPPLPLRWFLLLAIYLASALPGVGAAQVLDPVQRAAQEKEAKQQLDAVRARIKTLTDARNAMRGERSEALTTLRDKELALADVARDVHQLDQQLAEEEGRLAALEGQRAQLETTLRTQRQALAALLRSAYALGHGEELKLLLQQDDVAAVARVLAYHRYFQRAQTGRIDRVLADLQQLATVQESIRSATRELEATRDAQRAQAEKLESERDERARLIASMDTQLKDQAAQLAALGKDEGALNDLLEQLRDVFADIPQQLAATESLAAARGRLAWPLKGKLVTAFGSRDASDRASSGVLIAANHGTPVRAISHGRIAFADWLRGYGLMIIVDHGEGYLSLYGGNETLLKSVGDWIDGGDTVATSGASGGQKVPGLYFELRVKGQPVNPRGWMKGAP